MSGMNPKPLSPAVSLFVDVVMVVKIKKTQLAIVELIHQHKRTNMHSSAIFHCIAKGFPEKRLLKNPCHSTLNLFKNCRISFLPTDECALNFS